MCSRPSKMIDISFSERLLRSFSRRSKKMARREARPPAQREVCLTPRARECVSCGKRLSEAYHAQRTLMTFRGVVILGLVVRLCRKQESDLYHLPYRAEELR